MNFMNRLDGVLDWFTQVLYTVIEFLFRLVALASLPALVAWVVLVSLNLYLGGALFETWRWLFPAMTVVQIVGLDSNLICLLADAALDRVPVGSERVLRLWKVRQIVRSVVIALAGGAMILPLVLIGSSQILPVSGPVPAWLAILRTVAIVAVVVLNVVLSPLVRRRVHAELESFQTLYLQNSRARVAEKEGK